MKRTLVAALVGAVIIFGWQSVSWMLLPFHHNAYIYTPEEENLLGTLSSTLQQEGTYLLPGMKPGTSQEKQMEKNKQMEGKPWAQITYHKSFKYDMVGTMARGFLIALIAVWIVCWLVKGINGFSNIFIRSLMIGFLMWLFVWYNQRNWFELSWPEVYAELIDCVAAWGLCGIWLGWWLNRGKHI